jgi:hypothetical protein
MTRGDTPFALACELRRLWVDVRKPHVFDDAKRDLAARIAALGAVSPCASCEASRLRHALDAARQTTRAATARAERAERLLVSVRPPRPRRSKGYLGQPDLFIQLTEFEAF